MNHTIITIDLAHIGGRDPNGAIQGLLARITDTVAFSGPAVALDLDEWKMTVVQVSTNGQRTPVPGYRFTDTGHHPDELQGVADE